MKNKKELIRVVRDEKGEFSLDFTGKKSGRGAYVCPNAECIEKAAKNKGFEKSFKSFVPKEIYENLKRELDSYGK